VYARETPRALCGLREASHTANRAELSPARVRKLMRSIRIDSQSFQRMVRSPEEGSTMFLFLGTAGLLST
jgi:hypothetical protein